MGWTKRNNDEYRERSNHHDERSDPEDDGISLGRHDVFFDQKLECICNRLKQAMRAYAHWTKAYLHVSENFALQPVHRNHRHGQAQENQKNVDEGPQKVSCLSRSGIALEI